MLTAEAVQVVLVLAAIAGVGWLVVDYAFIVALHRKMVRQTKSKTNVS